MSKEKPYIVVKFTWAQAFRDMVNNAMNRGQLLGLGVLFIVILILFRSPKEKIGMLLADIYSDLLQGYLIGYILWLLTVIVWWYHVKTIRSELSKEYKRMGTEKSNLQKKAADKNFPSSNRKRRGK